MGDHGVYVDLPHVFFSPLPPLIEFIHSLMG